MNFYLICYDVADDRRRLRVAKVLEAVGERVQRSVFEAYLTEKQMRGVLGRLRRVLREEEDSLRVYRLCAQCRQTVGVVGTGEVTQPPEGAIVV